MRIHETDGAWHQVAMWLQQDEDRREADPMPLEAAVRAACEEV